MISSEVQRTLVKSPPELWTELSDPESLARHLGEFGEIRITRIEPEQLVEWEGERASGTVALQASGWGTRVTLTVAHDAAVPLAADGDATDSATDAGEAAVLAPGHACGQPAQAATESETTASQPAVVPDAPPDAPSAEAAATTADALAAEPAETTPEAPSADPIEAPADAPSAEPAEKISDAPSVEPTTGAAPSAADTPGAADQLRDGDSRPTASSREELLPGGQAHTPGPATAAARMAAQRDGAPIDTRPHHERLTELWRPAPGVESSFAEAAPALEPIPEISSAESPLAMPDPPAAEPRHGFFARLFGRGRKHAGPRPPEPGISTPAEELGDPPLGATDPGVEPDAWTADGAPSEPSAVATVTAGSSALEAPAGFLDEPRHIEPPADGASEHSAAETPARLETPQVTEAEAAPDDVPAERSPDPASVPATSGETTPSAGRDAARDPEPPAPAAETPPAVGAERSSEQEPAAAATDLSAELAAAEGIAAEQVEAVLTGVLDRLGAAHHRPFSRS